MDYTHTLSSYARIPSQQGRDVTNRERTHKGEKNDRSDIKTLKREMEGRVERGRKRERGEKEMVPAHRGKRAPCLFQQSHILALLGLFSFSFSPACHLLRESQTFHGLCFPAGARPASDQTAFSFFLLFLLSLSKSL